MISLQGEHFTVHKKNWGLNTREEDLRYYSQRKRFTLKLFLPFDKVPAVSQKRSRSADCATIYTIFLFLCTQSSYSNLFWGGVGTLSNGRNNFFKFFITYGKSFLCELYLNSSSCVFTPVFFMVNLTKA